MKKNIYRISFSKWYKTNRKISVYFFFVLFGLCTLHPSSSKAQCLDLNDVFIAYECSEGVEGNPNAGKFYQLHFNIPPNGNAGNFCFSYTNDLTNQVENTFVILDPSLGAEVNLGYFLDGTIPDISLKKVNLDCSENGMNCSIGDLADLLAFTCPTSRSGCESGSGNVNNYRPTPILFVDFTDNPSGVLSIDRNTHGIERGGNCCNDGTRCLEVQIVPNDQTIGYNVQAYAAGAVEFYIEVWNDNDCDNGSSSACTCESGCLYDLDLANDPDGSGNYSCTLNGGSENAYLPFCAPSDNQPFSVILCKPGDDNTGFYIESLSNPMVDDIKVNQSCSGQIEAQGFDESPAPTWNSLNGSPLNYLSNTTGSSVNFNYSGPDITQVTIFEYEVCGIISNVVSSCTGMVEDICKPVQVTVFPELTVNLNTSLNCTSNELTITAEVNGGSGEYSISWMNDAGLINDQTTTSLNISEPGNYSILVSDDQFQMTCIPLSESLMITLGDLFCCGADAGDILQPSDEPALIHLCMGDDLDGFMMSYTMLDEEVPNPIENYSYRYLLSNNNGDIVQINSMGDFDFSTLTPGNYFVHGLSYESSNQPSNIDAYLSGLSNVLDIELDQASGEFCLDLDNENSNDEQIQVVVQDHIDISLNNPIQLCLDAGNFIFEATPSNGDFDFLEGLTDMGDGTAVLNVSEAGVGIHTVSYTILDDYGCESRIEENFEILDLPEVNVEEPGDQCVGDGDIVLMGFPLSANAYFTTTLPGGLSENNDGTAALKNENLIEGTYQATYHYDDGSCSNSHTIEFTIFGEGSSSIVQPDDHCINAPDFIIEGFPKDGNGSFTSSSSGLSDLMNGTALIDVSVMGIGTHEIYYDYTSDQGCTSTSSIQFEIFSLSQIEIVGVNDICSNQDALQISGIPQDENGSFTITGNIGLLDNNNGTAEIDISTLAPGEYVVSYNYTDGNSCESSVFQKFEILEAAEVSIEMEGDQCISNATLDFTGFPTNSNGSFSSLSNGLMDNLDGTAQINTLDAGAGMHSITYDYIAPNGCLSSTTIEFEIFDLPVVSLNDPLDRCVNDVDILLMGSPSTGSFSSASSGLTDHMNGTATFDLQTAGAGIHEVQYSFQDENTCLNSITQEFEIFDVPVIDLQNIAVCQGSIIEITPSVSNGTTPYVDHLWEIIDPGTTGLSLDAFSDYQSQSPLVNTTNATEGVAILRYSLNDENSCQTSHEIEFSINSNPVTMPMIMDVCIGSTVSLDGNPSGGNGNFVTHSWESNPDFSSTSTAYAIDNMDSQIAVLDATNATEGVVYLNYFATDENGCVVKTPVEIMVFSPPNAGQDGWTQICNAEIPATINLVSALNGTPDIDGNWLDLDYANVNLENPNSVDFRNTPAGIYRFEYSVVGKADCADASAIVSVEVQNCFDLAIMKSAPDGPFYKGQNIQYKFTVFNQGIIDAYDVEVRDIYNSNEFEFDPELNQADVLANDHDWITSGGYLTTSIDFIPAGQFAEVILELQIPDDFSSTSLRNNSQLGFFTNSPGSTYKPFDEDESPVFNIDNELDDEISDDFNGGMDHPMDNDAFDFESIVVCQLSAGQFEYFQCESFLGSNQASFDLFDPTVLQGLDLNGDGDNDSADGDAGNEILSFHLSESDALSNVAAVSSPRNTNNDILYARLEDVNGCIAIAELHLTVVTLPSISVQPSDQTVCIGSNVSFSTVVSGENVFYQWQVDEGFGFTNVVDATASLLNLENVDFSYNGNLYRVIVSSQNSSGVMCNSIVSDAALLSIYPESILACNDVIQVSLGDDCQAHVSLDMLLESDVSHDNYTITITDSNGDIVNNPLTVEYINHTLSYTVVDNCTQNSCWGKIEVEDKLAPQIHCLDDITLNCNQPFNPILPIAQDACDPNPTVKILSDELTDVSCDDVQYAGYSAIRELHFQAEDNQGNLSEVCILRVYFERSSLAEIVFPADVILPCYSPQLNSNNPLWDNDNNGYPDPQEGSGQLEIGTPTINGNPIFPNDGFCEMNVTYEDVELVVCESTFKVLRTWTALDWCTSEIRIKTQIIKVMDNQAPINNCPLDFAKEYVEHDNCLASHEVEPPNIIYECGTWSYTVDYLYGGEELTTPIPTGPFVNTNVVGPEGGPYTITDLPIGYTWIRYTIQDQCGNVTQDCRREIQVLDTIPPNPVCEAYTVVSLNQNGYAELFAESLDDGGFDNCSDVSFLVDRMTEGCGHVAGWKESVKFCCEDLGKDLMLALQLTDESGNTNICMVTVHVQDKIDPILHCPPDVTINCGDLIDPEFTGFATGGDNCINPQIEFTDQGFLGTCGQGEISRIWSVSNESSSVNCTQKISVIELDPFDESHIQWPPDQNLTGCAGVDTAPSMMGEPVYSDDQCNLVAHTYSDQEFSFADGACLKILRTWTIIDWCQYDPNGINSPGLWQSVQIIKLSNAVSPEILSCAPITICTYEDDCYGNIEVEGLASDDCTPSSELNWSFQIKLQNQADFGSVNQGYEINGSYPVGHHQIKWMVEDYCGNSTECFQNLIIEDCKSPTPYCSSGITTVIMPSVGNIEIWASDFDLGSYDNCDEDLVFSFSSNSSNQNMTFDCDNIGINSVEIWVTDDAGNQAYCETIIHVQDNNEICGNISQALRVDGKITTCNLQSIENVQLELIATDVNMNSSQITLQDGLFTFEDVVSNLDYQLIPSKNDDPLNGVSTLDLVLIQKHILQLQPLNAPCKIIAADINGDGVISAVDLIELRKLILGITTDFPNNTSWRFINRESGLTDFNIFPFVESYHYTDLAVDKFDQDFLGVKIGDVNETVVANLEDQIIDNRSQDKLVFSITNQQVDKGELIEIKVMSNEFEKILGLQSTFDFDHDKMSFISINSGVLEITEMNYSLNHLEQGEIPFSWSSPIEKTVNSDEVLLSLVFRINATCSLEDVFDLSSTLLASELYTSDYQILSPEIVFDDITLNERFEFEVSQNSPNPFNSKTEIFVTLPEDEVVKIEVYHSNGELVYRTQSTMKQGVNQVTLDANHLNTSGIYYYRIEAGAHIKIKKMIMMK